MATAAQVAEFRKAQSNVAVLAERELQRFYASLDPDDGLGTVRALELFLPELIQSYGEIGATVAADFYDELRDASGVSGSYRAVLADPIPLEQATISTKWAVGPLFGQTDPVAAFNNLADVTDRLVKQHGRNTIQLNGHADPARVAWARVPTGPETCEFCLMLASRGAVYASEKAAGAVHKFHGKCDCVSTPIWSDRDLADLNSAGYDPDELYDRWQDAVEARKAEAANN
ncbi:hypothetical protein [Nocardioides abyssi]|uniref:VG15 protein n=1 Tax=Nocardioides abyssi TaxID=3058370 RepID=UPI003F6C5958